MSVKIQISRFPIVRKQVIYVDLRKFLFAENKEVVFNCENSPSGEEFKRWLWNNIKAKNNVYWLLRDLVDRLRFQENLQVNYYNFEANFATIFSSCLTWMLSFESLKFVRQDVLELNQGIVCQQVNIKKKMGKGLALAIRQRFPNVYQEYMDKNWQLADIQLVKVSEELYICNIAGQEEYGNDKRYTNFSALEQGLDKLAAIAQTIDVNVYFPWRFGSGNAGGVTWQNKLETWDNVLEIIADKIPTAVICKRG